MKAPDILKAGIKHMEDRAATYDKPQGERSMGATVEAFRAVTGHDLTEEQGWLFMALLKAVRSQQGEFRADSYEDGAAYFALAGEAAAEVRDLYAGLADADTGRVTPLSEVKARFAVRNPPSILEPVDLADLLEQEREPSAKTAAALEEAREIREEWDERRMDIIGQNGNDGLHYDELPDGLIWSQAPEWAHSLGSVGIHDDLVWYSDERYRYALSSEEYAFNVAENTAYSRSIHEVRHIASRPSKAPEPVVDPLPDGLSWDDAPEWATVLLESKLGGCEARRWASGFSSGAMATFAPIQKGAAVWKLFDMRYWKVIAIHPGQEPRK